MKESPISALVTEANKTKAAFQPVQTARNGGHSLMGLRRKYPGMNNVVELIKNIIMEFRGSQQIRDAALAITESVPEDPRTGRPDRRNINAMAKTIHDWIVHNIDYVWDPNGIEQIQTPEATFKMRTGDCDDMVILGGVLLESLGIPVRIKLIGEQQEFTHIYLDYQAGGEWVSFDPTLALYPGYQLPLNRIGAKKTVPIQRPNVPIKPIKPNRGSRSGFVHN